MKKAQASLSFFLARKGSAAVILRRGPTRAVQMILWDRSDDSFAEGQWLKGRVYEDRCDLSPSGSFFIYFAAKFQPGSYSWTAISRPPYFTALCRWPMGDAWGGGGLFETDRRVQPQVPDPGAIELPDQRPASFQIEPYSHREDVNSERLKRDGWRLLHPGEFVETSRKKQGAFMIAAVPRVLEKPSPAGRKTADHTRLRLTTTAIGVRNGPFYAVNLTLHRGDSSAFFTLEHVGCADWDRKGDLLLAKDGRLYRMARGAIGEAARKKKDLSLEDAALLADFAENSFRELPPPAGALNP